MAKRRVPPGVVASVVAVCGAWLVSAAGTAAAHPSVAIEPQVCSSCSPPLLYSGGPVLSTNT
jgi:hypothetical protein